MLHFFFFSLEFFVFQNRPKPSAPTTTAAPTRTATPTPTHNPAPVAHNPHQHLPNQQHHAPAPMMQQQQHAPMMQQAPQQSGGIMSSIAGGIMNGMTFGVGSAVANRAVDAVMGPRTVQHEFKEAPAAAPAAAPLAPAAAPLAAPVAAPMFDQNQQAQFGQPMQQNANMLQSNKEFNSRCSMEGDNFSRCMQLNNNSLDSCSNYMSILQQCQRQ